MNDTKTVSGAIVHITDADEAPLVKCLVDITPKQSGTGTPSPDNVRQISGWESVDVNVSGKNLLSKLGSETLTNGGLTFERSGDGSVNISGTSTTAYPQAALLKTTPINQIILPIGTTVTLSCTTENVPSGAKVYAIYYERDTSTSYANVKSHSTIDGSITFTTETAYAHIIIVAQNTGITYSEAVANIQLELGTTATAYAPYNGHTTTTDLGRTVYGGTLDVVSGVLTVTWVVAEPTASMWSYNSSAGRWETNLLTHDFPTPKPTGNSRSAEVIAEAYETNTSVTTGGIGCFRYVNGVYVYNNSSTTPPTGKFCYPLATPQTYTLTPTQVSTLLGENNVWADSGDVEITYHTDTLGIYNKIYINGSPYFRPNDFEVKREDVYAGEYTSCTGKLIADKIGWKYSDLTLKWDILPDEDLVYLTTLTGIFSIAFRDSDGQHTEQVIRRGFANTPTRVTGPSGTKIWTDVEMEISFLNTHTAGE